MSLPRADSPFIRNVERGRPDQTGRVGLELRRSGLIGVAAAVAVL
jgi:hypothetical protein